MSHDYRTISVDGETFEKLRDAKPEGVTWARYLAEQCGVLADE